ncbi:DUF5634 family protein [Geomonas sp. RF6]|uniref:PilZ-like domain-containing protein n=1 Tax=Geomonas sp. RF6 TaxID=2897342 RepID=UPI001E382EF2|nr:PilZ-like domain-containing protein [Geomonas sp. RF6]UFS71801.1 DUF5634 family protein [Geomonas sp. RF6]
MGSSNCRDYFRPGMRARVEIGPGGNGCFVEWADVVTVDDSLITLRLSRDMLPDGLSFEEGLPVLVRGGDEGNVKALGFSCEAMVVSTAQGGEVQVRLTEEVKPDELREFYRLNAEIPVTLFNLSAGGADIFACGTPSVQGVVSRIINISGGGIRTETMLEAADGDIVYATFHLPLPEPKAVPLVAQVVHTETIGADGNEKVFSTGLRYVHINERDRDSIVRYVCNEEIRRIRLTRKEFLSFPDK